MLVTHLNGHTSYLLQFFLQFTYEQISSPSLWLVSPGLLAQCVYPLLQLTMVKKLNWLAIYILVHIPCPFQPLKPPYWTLVPLPSHHFPSAVSALHLSVACSLAKKREKRSCLTHYPTTGMYSCIISHDFCYNTHVWEPFTSSTFISPQFKTILAIIGNTFRVL